MNERKFEQAIELLEQARVSASNDLDVSYLLIQAHMGAAGFESFDILALVMGLRNCR